MIALIDRPFGKAGSYQLPLIVEAKHGNAMQHTVRLYRIEMHKNITLAVPYPMRRCHILASSKGNCLIALSRSLRRRSKILTNKYTREYHHQRRLHCRPDNALQRNPGCADNSELR